MADAAKTVTRERIWVEKYDHTVDPPRLVETVFVERGPAGERTEVTRHEPGDVDVGADVPGGGAT